MKRNKFNIPICDEHNYYRKKEFIYYEYFYPKIKCRYSYKNNNYIRFGFFLRINEKK